MQKASVPVIGRTSTRAILTDRLVSDKPLSPDFCHRKQELFRNPLTRGVWKNLPPIALTETRQLEKTGECSLTCSVLAPRVRILLPTVILLVKRVTTFIEKPSAAVSIVQTGSPVAKPFQSRQISVEDPSNDRPIHRGNENGDRHRQDGIICRKAVVLMSNSCQESVI